MDRPLSVSQCALPLRDWSQSAGPSNAHHLGGTTRAKRHGPPPVLKRFLPVWKTLLNHNVSFPCVPPLPNISTRTTTSRDEDGILFHKRISFSNLPASHKRRVQYAQDIWYARERYGWGVGYHRPGMPVWGKGCVLLFIVYINVIPRPPITLGFNAGRRPDIQSAPLQLQPYTWTTLCSR